MSAEIEEINAVLERVSLNTQDRLDIEEIMQNQATINIGTIGHVAHGKSTIVRAISGVHTIRFKNELERNITIKLGYANAKIFKCTNPDCPKPDAYQSHKSSAERNPVCKYPKCGSKLRLMKHVSFVDCPGHDILMATMLNGAAVMDAAFLLVSANESCPQPQTSEHLAAVENMKLKNILILQNKIDLVLKETAEKHYKEIIAFTRGTAAGQSSVIPVSGQLKHNIDAVCQYIAEKIPQPIRDLEKKARMIVIRSFDINKPGTGIDSLKGGVAGGSILQGILRVGDTVEVRPGIVRIDDNGNFVCSPLITKITSLFAESNQLKVAIPGGLIGVGTNIDPSICRADRLVGQVIGHVGHLPDIFFQIEINFFLLRRLLGVHRTEETRIQQLKVGEVLLVNIGSTTTGGKITVLGEETAFVQLLNPVCTEIGEKVALSRKIQNNWRLIGWGNIINGKKVAL